ncbi:nitrite reductase small subunit NirD [Streptomyces sp. NPDC059740]|uniref:nitrite reductase small subunit NirD n=1 Tax=Streptomyces sp. NPDC059740 TaxID=3346926 RepID=UPI003650D0E8
MTLTHPDRPAVATAPAPPPATHVQLHDGEDWTTVLPGEHLTPGRGVTVLLDGRQVAVFLDRNGALHALENRDPFSGAHVISRGILGSCQGAPVVVSPMYKQRFDLRTGACLDEPTAPDGSPADLTVWPVRWGAPTTS